MTDTTFDKQQLVAALREEWTAIDELISSLPERDWSRPSGLPGWSVQDVVAHIIGTESMLAGHETPESDVDVTELPHVHNEIAARNEQWVRALRAESPAAMCKRFRDITTQRGQALEAMTQEDFDAPSWTPAGEGTYAQFMRIRQFDCWLHEQDIRHALGRPGHEGGACARLALEQIVTALGYIVGKRGKAPDGSTVTFELTGPAARTVHVAVDGKAKVVAELPAPATVTIRLDAVLFSRLAGGRTRAADHRDEIELDGDAELGRQLTDNLAFTI